MLVISKPEGLRLWYEYLVMATVIGRYLCSSLDDQPCCAVVWIRTTIYRQYSRAMHIAITTCKLPAGPAVGRR
jgi:hypothetical protein